MQEGTGEGDVARWDVVVHQVPGRTPAGEPFVAALSRELGLDGVEAARLVRETPSIFLRAASGDAARSARDTLRLLGADVTVTRTGSRARGAGPSSIPPRSSPPAVPSAPVAPAEPVGTEWSPRTIRPPVSVTPPPHSRSSIPHATPGAAVGRASFSLPPVKQERRLSAGAKVLAGVVVLGAILLSMGRWLRHAGDTRQLGSVPKADTQCVERDCLALVKLPPDRHKVTLLVAWRDGCLAEHDYGAYLEGLHAQFGEKGLRVAGAALAVPEVTGARGLGSTPMAVPKGWAQSCNLAFDLVPTEDGHVDDFLAWPATYLFDERGYLLAAWRGGMSPPQRDKLAAWLAHEL